MKAAIFLTALLWVGSAGAGASPDPRTCRPDPENEGQRICESLPPLGMADRLTALERRIEALEVSSWTLYRYRVVAGAGGYPSSDLDQLSIHGSLQECLRSARSVATMYCGSPGTGLRDDPLNDRAFSCGGDVDQMRLEIKHFGVECIEGRP